MPNLPVVVKIGHAHSGMGKVGLLNRCCSGRPKRISVSNYKYQLMQMDPRDALLPAHRAVA